MGPSIATEVLLNSRFVDEFELIHIDTADRRPVNKLGALDLTNFLLAFKHYLLLLQSLVFRRVDAVYVPISQTAIGFLRDAVFILMACCFRKKVILHLRGGYFRQFYDSSGAVVRWVVRKNLAHADRMIVLGTSLRPLFAGLVPEEKISVVPNGRDLPLDMKAKRERGDKGVYVLFLSNLIASKGFKDVLHAAVEVVRKVPNTRFIFAGAWEKDSDKVECVEFIEATDLMDHVELRGPVVGTAKVTLLQDASIFAFPTYYPMEGHPWALVEAMAAGLPIISTDHGCIAESVIDGVNGFIVPKRDPAALATKILFLIEHPDRREKMGAASRKLYEENFTTEHFITRMIDAVNASLDEVPAGKELPSRP
jgi:glycosyltransferase involved in cell wall biosynthesis